MQAFNDFSPYYPPVSHLPFDTQKEIYNQAEEPKLAIQKFNSIVQGLEMEKEKFYFKLNRVYGFNGIGSGFGLRFRKEGGVRDLQDPDCINRGSKRNYHLESFLCYEWFLLKKAYPTFSIDSGFVIFAAFFLKKTPETTLKVYGRSKISTMFTKFMPL